MGTIFLGLGQAAKYCQRLCPRVSLWRGCEWCWPLAIFDRGTSFEMSAWQELRGLNTRFVRMLALTGMLLVAGGLEISSKGAVADSDLWWHLSVGNWIVQHHTFPHTGILSRTAADRPWIAHSWGFEVLLSKAYSWFGLVGVGLLSLILQLGFVYSLFWTLRRISGRFWAAWLMTLVGFYAFHGDIVPRPMLFTILLFTIEASLILVAHRSGDLKRLYWLPLLFFVWSNFHIQFFYGLFLITLLTAVVGAQQLATRLHLESPYLLPPVLRVEPLLRITAACFLATLVSPYSYHLYQVGFRYLHGNAFHAFYGEFAPLDFRNAAHYVQLLITAGAFFAVGRQRKVDLFKLAMLLVCTLVGFRASRDAWFICIPAIACVADSLAGGAEQEEFETLTYKGVVAAILIVLLFLMARNYDYTNAGLLRAASLRFPAKAVAFIRQNQLSGPIYNTENWGGFLMWAAPEYPVAIDGRIELYGDDVEFRYMQVLQGAPFYASDPDVKTARVLLVERLFPLSWRLEADPHFQFVYQDPIADVFVPSAR